MMSTLTHCVVRHRRLPGLVPALLLYAAGIAAHAHALPADRSGCPCVVSFVCAPLDAFGARLYRMPASMQMQGDPVVIQPGTRDFLEPNRPNPFGTTTEATTIAYALAAESRVQLRIYDFFYQHVVTLVDATQAKGRYVVQFMPPTTMPSGMYFYELKTDRFYELRRMMYVK